jgi:hypothetical protein
MNAWIILIARYGLPFALELSRIFKDGREPTTADFEGLISKYGSKSADDYLREAQERAAAAKPPTP